MAQTKLSPRKKQAIFRYTQYALLAVIAIIALAMADWNTLTKQVFNLDIAAKQFPGIITVALKNTLIYTALGFAVGLSGGLLLALMRISSIAPYRCSPPVTSRSSVVFPPCWSSSHSVTAFPWRLKSGLWITLLPVTLSLGVVSAAYISEVLRAGLQAVPKGQYEAARSLGMSHTRAMVSITVPQAFRIVLPPLTNEVILLTKDSSLVYLLGVTVSQYELAKFGREGITAGGAGLTPLVVAGLCYLIITVPLGQLSAYFEKRTQARSRK